VPASHRRAAHLPAAQDAADGPAAEGAGLESPPRAAHTPDPLAEQLLAEWTSRSSLNNTAGRFHCTDITKDTSLGKAARLELDGMPNRCARSAT
jgi:hypothetical protein